MQEINHKQRKRTETRTPEDVSQKTAVKHCLKFGTLMTQVQQFLGAKGRYPAQAATIHRKTRSKRGPLQAAASNPCNVQIFSATQNRSLNCALNLQSIHNLITCSRWSSNYKTRMRLVFKSSCRICSCHATYTQ